MNESFKKLIEHAEALGLTVRFVTQSKIRSLVKHTAADACYDHATKTIYFLQSVLSHGTNVALYVLAHEIGHAIDYRKNKEHDVLHAKAVNMHKIYKDAGVSVEDIPSIFADILMMVEERAYDEGEAVLKLLNIEIKESLMRSLRASSLQSYRKLLTGCSTLSQFSQCHY